MRKLLYIFAFWTIVPTVCQAQGFTTNNTNGNLIDANGNNFIIKGMSVPLQFYQADVNASIAAVRKNTNANCLRIVMYTYTPDAVWQQCVQSCIDNDIIPMVELHDVTGNTDKTRLEDMGKWWATKASYLSKTNIAKYILINICNEWGTWDVANTSGYDWRDGTINAVKAIRDAGIKTTLVCDAVGYGQDIDDAKNIRTYAKDIMNADAGFLKANANLMFSIHMYCEWKKGGDNIDVIGTIKNSGIPILVGEFGFQHSENNGTCDIDELAIINKCQQYGVGWLAWSQKGNGNGVEYLDLCNDWNCSSLSDWGNTVVNSANGTKTAATCSIYLGLTANAGADQLIMDEDKNGTHQITLNGTQSSTNAGTLTYIWIENNKTIATTATPTLDMAVGTHRIVLTVSDGTNAPKSDDVIVTVKTPSLSYKKQVSVSSTEAKYGNIASNAVDGDTATRWSSEYTDPQTFTVDLLDVYSVNSINIWWETASAKNYTVEVSTNGTKWTTISTQNISSNNNRTDSIKNLAVNARYVRMNGTSRNGTWGYSIFEFEVWGNKATITQTIALQKGWNLISTNVSPTDSSIATVFKNLDVQEIKDMNSFWRKGQADEFNSLKTVTAGEGYLVNMNAAGRLTVTGTPVSSSNLQINTSLNWMLMGCPYQSATPFSQNFDATNCSAIKNFEGFWTPNGASNSIQDLESGKGYFVRGK